MADIKLKDNKGVEHVYEGVNTLNVPSADGNTVDFNAAADFISSTGTDASGAYKTYNSGHKTRYIDYDVVGTF